MKKLLLLLSLLMVTSAGFSQDLQRRSSLGFSPVLLDSSRMTDYGLQTPKGVIITDILTEGTVSSIGAEEEDLLISLNDVQILSIQDLLVARDQKRAGDMVHATIIRDGSIVVLKGAAKPQPYEAHPNSEVIYDAFDFKHGRIRTIITKPKLPGKHPVIFFIPGYTCASIDNLHPIHPYRKLIDSLVALNYVVYRMEKPGIGDNENTGNCRELGFDQELESYFKGYDQLKKYSFIDQDNIFLWGHSMGGLYAPLIAAQKQPKGVLFYGMVHDSWTEYLLRMVRYQNPRINASDYLETDTDVKNLYALLYEHYHLGKSSKELAKMPNYKKILERDFAFDGESQILYRHEDFWREIYQHSMTKAFHDYNGYVLSMNGEADLEVVNSFSQREVIHIVNHYHEGKGEFCYFPKTDHSMIEVGTLEEGAQIRYQPRYREMLANNFNYQIVTKTHQWIQNKMVMN